MKGLKKKVDGEFSSTEMARGLRMIEEMKRYRQNEFRFDRLRAFRIVRDL
jgi:hypothetical protein